MFPGSGYTTRPQRKLYVVWEYEARMMAVAIVILSRKFIFAIFDFSQIHKSSSLRSSLILLPDSRKQGYSRCCRAYKLTYALSHISFLLMVAILDFQHSLTSASNPICLSVLPDRESTGITVRISLLPSIYAYIHDIVRVRPVSGSHVWSTSCTD